MGELWVSYDIELMHEKISDMADNSMFIYDMANPTSGFASYNTLTRIKGEDGITFNSGLINLAGVVPGYYMLYIEVVPDSG